MDEPTASLDPARRDDLAASLRQLAANGTTLLVATHDEDFVQTCCTSRVTTSSPELTTAPSPLPSSVTRGSVRGTPAAVAASPSRADAM